MKWTISLLLVAAVYMQASNAQDGIVKGADLPSYLQPIYLTPGTLDFYPHDEGGNLVFKDGASIDLYCKGGFRVPANPQKILTATYSSLTNQFKIGTDNYELKKIVCDRKPMFEAKIETEPCGGEYKRVSIGYDVVGRGFKTIYELCFDYTKMEAKYSKYILRPGVLDKSSIGDRPKFQDVDSFGEYKFAGYYAKAPELTIRKNCITRGHLAPQADFFYGVEQLATFVFPNASPQWKGLNAGNWEELERVIRSNLRKRTLESYTGVLGVMPYDNRKGDVRPALYLDNEHEKIPVPKLFFRVAYDPNKKEGVVFVGVNNVFLNPLPSEYIVCNPVTNKIKGINLPNVEVLSRGYMYACDFNEFRQMYPYLPNLDVQSLLFKNVDTL